MTSDLVCELEARAYRAWPAARTWPLGGWRLRWSEGVTRRGNSAFPEAVTGDLALGERIDRVRRFYRERGAAARFQLSPRAQPTGLDAELARRGFQVESPVSIQVADAAAVAAGAGGAGFEASVAASPEGDWLALADARSRFAASPDVLRGFLARIGPAAGYALARDAGEPIAMGLGVRDGGWAGVFLMLTLPEHRRRGAGASVLGALAGWARAGGAARLYLQVERDNPAALRLYARAGFGEVYGYHYRMLPAP